MAFKIEFSAECEKDFELIFDHLIASYRSFGESAADAFDHAAQRTKEIRRATDRLTRQPLRGTLRDDLAAGVRHLTVDRATFWFDVDEAKQRVRILAVFFGGQDHIRHMLARLLQQSRRR